MTGIDWKHTNIRLSEQVYDVYMKYWQNTELAAKLSLTVFESNEY